MSGEDRSSESQVPPLPQDVADPSSTRDQEFRWQALFRRSSEPFFLLNRRRRFLFVNRAWERLTGLTAPEACGLVCARRPPAAQDSCDVVIRSLCCPPPEALEGKSCRARRLAPASGSTSRWWDIEFLPLRDDRGLLCVLGKITVVSRNQQASLPPLPEKLMALRERTAQRYGFEQLASAVPAMQRVIDQVRLASRTRVPVLITGEPGTGKQWIARTIHYQGHDREAPFMALDCTRIPAGALAAALSFDGNFKKGAARRTLYLKEPSALPRDLQERLCNLLGEAGGASDWRILAGCHSDPLQEIKAGRLLETLHSALSTLVIALPPLRERQADRPTIVERFSERAVYSKEGRIPTLTPDAWELVRAYHWPENLSELHAVLRVAAAHAPTDAIDACHFPAALRLAVRMDQTPAKPQDHPVALDQILEQAERRLIIHALRKAKGNRSRAAELLSIWRARLIRRMEALGITEW